MKAVIHSLLLVIAQATDCELARMVKYRQVENRILRSKLPKRIEITPKERQTLLKYGVTRPRVGRVLGHLGRLTAYFGRHTLTSDVVYVSRNSRET